jgi:hypothetical protein
MQVLFNRSNQRGGIMERADQYALCNPALLNKASAVWRLLCHIAQRVLAILAVLGMIYGLIAAEVELAKIEQITDTVPR